MTRSAEIQKVCIIEIQKFLPKYTGFWQRGQFGIFSFESDWGGGRVLEKGKEDVGAIKKKKRGPKKDNRISKEGHREEKKKKISEQLESVTRNVYKCFWDETREKKKMKKILL